MIDTKNIWCVIPVYNNSSTIENVAYECLHYLDNILIIDDGSTDADLSKVFQGTSIQVIRHEKNRGKGYALKTALCYLEQQNARFMITIDGDGQHYPKDIVKFLQALDEEEDTIIIGCRDFESADVPEKSRFGRKFSNMWVKLETGVSCRDSQSGFRAYPVKKIASLKLHGNHYDFENEVLTRAFWNGLKLKEVMVEVYYSKPGESSSSFRLFRDNMRISLMHMRLIGRLLLPIPKKVTGIDWRIFKEPRKFIRTLLRENATPMGLAASASVGTFLAVLPLIGIHTIVIVYVSVRLHLNKCMSVAIQNIFMPPFSPLLCIATGYYIRHGRWMPQFDYESFQEGAKMLFWDWLVGSLIWAPLFAVLMGFIVYRIAHNLQSDNEEYTE